MAPLRFRWSRHTAWWIAVIGALVYFRHAVSPRSFLFRRDAFRLYLPLQSFMAEELRAGRFPTWFPYDGAGTSLVGSSVAGVLNPLNGLLWLLDPAQALKWGSLLAIALAGGGAWLWARALGARRSAAWLAASAYALSGYLVSVSDNTPYLRSAAALPWVAWAAERLGRRPTPRWAGALGLALAFTAWSGDVQAVGLQVASAGAILASHGRREGVRRLGWASAALLLLGLLWSPVLPALAAAARESERRIGLDPNEVLTGALQPVRGFELLFGPPYPPDAVDEPQLEHWLGGAELGGCWAASEFVGLLVVALAAAALLERHRRREGRLYGGMAGLALLLALGRAGGLYAWAVRHVPLWGSFRYPEKLAPYAVAPLCVLAALGASGLGRRRAAGRALVGAALLSAGLLFLGPRLLSLSGPPPEWAGILSTHAQARVLLGLGIALGALALHRWAPRGALLGVLALAFIQAILVNGYALGLNDVAWVDRRSPLLEAVQQRLRPGLERLCWNEVPSGEREDVASLGPVHPARWHLSSTRFYLPGEPGALTWLCSREPRCGTPCSRLLAAPLAVVGTEALGELPEPLPEVARLTRPAVTLVEDAQARPFASLPAVRHLPNLNAVAERLVEPGHAPQREALLVGEGPDAPAPSGTISVARPRPDTLEGEVDLASPGTAVWAEHCADGWAATLDGAPVPLLRADLAFCALAVPAGRHAYRLRYTPPGWPWAWLAYGLGWVGAVTLLGRARGRKTP